MGTGDIYRYWALPPDVREVLEKEKARTGSGAGSQLISESDEAKLEFLSTRLDQPIPLAYGRHLVAGAPIFQHKDSAGNTLLFIALGDGEWDSIEKLWVNGRIITLPNTAKVHFHPGIDGETGAETDPSARNQKQCSFWPASGFTKLTFSRAAYLALKLAPDPTAPGPEFDVRGIYKTRRVRKFDSSGNQTAYEYSSNTAWCLLDAWIALYLKPRALVNEALAAAEKAKIDFAAFSQAAADCDVDIGGGKKRFESHVVFLETTTLATVLDTFLALCGGYLLELNGKLGLYIDKARNSIFTFSTDNIIASSFAIPAKDPRELFNRVVIKARDIESGAGDTSKDFAPWSKTLDDEDHQDFIGRILKKELDFGAQTTERAERLGRYWLKRNLLKQQARLWTTLDAGALMPGDVVTAPKDHIFSATRDWEILEATDNPDGTRELFLQEYDPAIFSDTAQTQQGVEETSIDIGPQPGAMPVNSTYRPLSNPLTATDAGTTATVNIAAFTMRVAGTDISVNLGSISTLSFNTLYYIYYDDPNCAGGTVTFNTTTTKETALAVSGRFFLGSIRTPTDGGSDTIGNNDGGAGAQSGQIFILRPSTHTTVGTPDNPTRAYDGDTATFAQLFDTYAAPSPETLTLSGLPAAVSGGNVLSLKLKIISEVIKLGTGSVQARLRYSTDGKTTWTTIYDIDATRAKTLDEVTLGAISNSGLIHVEFYARYSSGVTAFLYLNAYEVWIETLA